MRGIDDQELIEVLRAEISSLKAALRHSDQMYNYAEDEVDRLRDALKKKGNKMAKDKVEKTMHEYKHGQLHSGSKTGPRVKSRKQAVAIALKQAGKSKKK